MNYRQNSEQTYEETVTKLGHRNNTAQKGRRLICLYTLKKIICFFSLCLAKPLSAVLIAIG